MLLLSDVKPALPFIIADIHPQDVVEMVEKIFPAVNWKCVSFDDNDEDFMLVKSCSCFTFVEGAMCIEVRTGQPLVMRPLRPQDER